MKKCLIYQPSGLGDIILSEPIAKHYHNLGYEITWPVANRFLNIKDHIKYVNFVEDNGTYFDGRIRKDTEDSIYLPLISASHGDLEFGRTGWLYSKYRMAGIDHSMWKTFEYVRNPHKEEILFKHFINFNEPYIVVNKYSSIGKREDLKVDTEYRVIEMEEVKDFSIIDWSTILTIAEEVHTVSTALKYVLYNIKHPNITVYRRIKGDNTFNSIKEIFNFDNFKYEA